MKAKILVIGLALGIGFTVGAAIRDDFNDSSLDTTIWETSLPFGDSAVVESDSHVSLINRGGLIPKETFANGIEIKGSFTIQNTLDVFKIYIRSGLADAESTFHEKTGVFFVFWGDGRAAHLAHSGGLVMGHVDGAISPVGTPTGFRIVDDGFRIRLYLNGSQSPIISGETSYRLGNRVIFYNRESVGSTFTTKIDYLEISGTCGTKRSNVNDSVLLRDDFDGSLICPNLWNTYNAQGSVNVAEGKARLSNFGGLESVDSLPTTIDIRGRFKFSQPSSPDHLKIGIRSDLEKPTATDYTGVFIGFDREHSTIGVAEAGLSWLAVKNFDLGEMIDHDFRITDDGRTIIVYIDNLTSPLITVKSDHRTGNHLFVHNREVGGLVDLDFVEVRSLAAPRIYTAIEVEFETEIGRQYQIQVSEDLSNWVDFQSPITGDGNLFSRIYSTKGSNLRFHRVSLIE